MLVSCNGCATAISLSQHFMSIRLSPIASAKGETYSCVSGVRASLDGTCNLNLNYNRPMF